jgi:hypothetical protein
MNGIMGGLNGLDGWIVDGIMGELMDGWMYLMDCGWNHGLIIRLHPINWPD